jgi:hypothetical protein
VSKQSKVKDDDDHNENDYKIVPSSDHKIIVMQVWILFVCNSMWYDYPQYIVDKLPQSIFIDRSLYLI